MSLDALTSAEIAEWALRELRQRRFAYPRLVATGRMSREAVDREIMALQQIRDDYTARAESEAKSKGASK